MPNTTIVVSLTSVHVKGQSVFYTTLCDQVCQWLATVRRFSLSTLVYSTSKTDCHDMTEILFKVALNIINQTKFTPVKMILILADIFLLVRGQGLWRKAQPFTMEVMFLWLCQLLVLSNNRVYITYAWYLTMTAIKCGVFFHQCLHISHKNIYMRVTQSWVLFTTHLLYARL